MSMANRICVPRKLLSLFFILICILSFIFLFSSKLNRQTTSLKTNAAFKKIINPSPVPIQPNEFPYFAILHDAYLDPWLPSKETEYKYALNGHTICGGALIADGWVLTAAHCIEGKDINKLGIALNLSKTQGQLNVNRGEEESYKYFYKVEAAIPHPAYSSSPNYDNDIALVQLSRNVPPSITRLKVPTDISSYDTSKQVTIVGVGCIDILPTPGLVAPYSKDQYELRYSLDIQKGYFNYTIQDKSENNPEIYLTNPQGIRKSVCSGDSGSPMVKGNALLGVTYSWITGDFINPGFGTLTYTRNQWIKDTIEQYDKIGKNCFANTNNNYSELILSKIKSTKKKLIINVSSKDDLYVTTNIVRDLQGTLNTLSSKEVWVNYSCDEIKPSAFHESLTLKTMGTCTPSRRYESCMKLQRDIMLKIYKSKTLYDDISSLNTHYGRPGMFLSR